MPFFQFIRSKVSEVSSGVSQQQQITSGVLDQIKGYIPKVQSAWIGGDEKEFEADVMRKIVPAMMELIAAIGGVNLNLNKATSVVDQADAKVKSMADELGDIFDKI
ncbi:MAG: WXG100 family type VII secretion target [Anaerolineales bacterium]